MEISSNDAIKISKTIKSLFRLLSNNEAVENGNKGLTNKEINSIYKNAKKVLYEIESQI